VGKSDKHETSWMEELSVVQRMVRTRLTSTFEPDPMVVRRIAKGSSIISVVRRPSRASSSLPESSSKWLADGQEGWIEPERTLLGRRWQ
jgi:hypothetical protein